MKISNVIVEQILNSTVVEDYAEILTPTEMKEIICESFNDSIVSSDGYIYGSYMGTKYCILCKNISYLGNPHPIYKKRIQIPDSFITLYNENIKKGITTLLIGVYKYKDTILFCDFDTYKYINNKSHNSSAHIYTIDLLNGVRNGIFKKKDYRNNIITVFDENNVNKFLEMKLNVSSTTGVEVFDTLDEFFASMFKEWVGIECYMEMIENGFNNKFQPEWPGFYLEYKLEKYLEENHKTDIIRYCQNKKNGDVDLDLYFPKLGMYGDLKTHSLNSNAIQGNDYNTIMDLIEKQSVYYIVCSHETEKDKNHGFVVTEFWNRAQNKTDLHSYGNKMKYSVKITKYYILEINKYNKKYLEIFKQGKNSDGKSREPKIMIPDKYIENFLVHIVEFDD